MSKNHLSRRDFLKSATAIGIAGTLPGAFFTSCNGAKGSALVPLRPESEWNIPKDVLQDRAIDGVPLKVGLIGCGGRGSGAAQNILDAAPNVSIVALGDLFTEPAEACRKELNEKWGQNIAPDMCFSGFDSYKKVIATGIDLVILTTPPAFRPTHFKAAVDAGKHIFAEKQVAVDTDGVRSMIADSRRALAKGLCVITGTQRHHQRVYIESYKQIQSGLIGDIVAGYVNWNQGSAWFKTKDPSWTDMEWMLRDWPNWRWISGDHILEQHVHNIDVFNWFSGLKPVKAVGFGARQQRVTGDQYDMFSVDFVYEGGVRVHSMCRQIDGCANDVSERIQGTKGVWTSDGVITDLEGNTLWRFDWEKEKADFKQTNPYVLEHVNLVNHIRNNEPISQAEETAISTMTAIMGRQSAYTGAEITWEQVMAMDMNLVPENPEFKNMDMSQFVVPVPGKAK